MHVARFPLSNALLSLHALDRWLVILNNAGYVQAVETEHIGLKRAVS